MNQAGRLEMSGADKTGRTLEAELLRAEMLLLDPAVRRDPNRAAALLGEDFIEFGSSGRVWSRDQILKLLATEKYSPPVMEGFTCRVLAKGVALVTYRAVRIKDDGEEREMTMRSSLWTRSAYGWRIRFHQGTRAG
jgi:hypothetical protein